MTEETIMSSISREERVAAILAPHLRVSVGPNPDCDAQNAAHDHALSVARAAIAALSPDERLIEALTKCRDTFRDYERQHEAKAQQIFANGKTQGLLNAERMAMQARLTKAARNREMAELCDAALSTTKADQ